jgi:hypothetical protein
MFHVCYSKIKSPDEEKENGFEIKENKIAIRAYKERGVLTKI